MRKVIKKRVKVFILLAVFCIGFFTFTVISEPEPIHAEPVTITAATTIAIVCLLATAGVVFATTGDIETDWKKASSMAEWYYENSDPVTQQVLDTCYTGTIAGGMLYATYTDSMLDTVKSTWASLVEGVETLDVDFSFLIPTSNFEDEFGNIYQIFNTKNGNEVVGADEYDVKVTSSVSGGSAISFQVSSGGSYRIYHAGNMIANSSSTGYREFRNATDIYINGKQHFINLNFATLSSSQYSKVGTFYAGYDDSVHIGAVWSTSGVVYDVGRLYRPEPEAGSICPNPAITWGRNIDVHYDKSGVLADGGVYGQDVIGGTSFPLDVPIDESGRVPGVLGRTATDVVNNGLVAGTGSTSYIPVYEADSVVEVGNLPPFIIDDDLSNDFDSSLRRMKLPLNLLMDKFPFCIPFDLAGALMSMQDEPEIPNFVFEIDWFPTNMEYNDIEPMTLNLNFEPLEPLAIFVRWGLLIIFNIGLIMLTRKIIRG